jgi:hypothetical protein
MLKAVRRKIVRLLLATAVAIILIGPPSVTPAYAGSCGTSGSHNCGG